MSSSLKESQIEDGKNHGLIPEGGESLYCDAGLLPLNRYPESENKLNTIT